MLTLPRINEGDKKKESELKSEFDRDAPAIFAGLLNLFSKTLYALPYTNVEMPSRMIDFCYLGEAMNFAMGKKSFTEIYKENRKESLCHSLDSSPIALAVKYSLSMVSSGKSILSR